MAGVDGRSIWAKRFKELNVLHVSDLGGFESASEGELSIIKRVAAIEVELELLETKFAIENGATMKEFELYLRAANTLKLQLQAIGLKRRPADMIDITDLIEPEAADGEA